MRFWLIFLLLVLPSYGWTQPREKVLVIDTLVSPADSIEIRVESTAGVNPGSDSMASPGDYRAVKKYKTGSPFYSAVVVISIALPADSAVILLPLDDSGGLFTIKGAYRFADTIHIRKWQVFHNCLPDTLKQSFTWYLNPGDGSDLKKLKTNRHYHDKIYVKDCDFRLPEKLLLNINGKLCNVTPKIHCNLGVVSVYHGHKKMSARKERRYDQRKLEGKSYRYFAASSYRERCYWYAQLDLSQSQ